METIDIETLVVNLSEIIAFLGVKEDTDEQYGLWLRHHYWLTPSTCQSLAESIEKFSNENELYFHCIKEAIALLKQAS
jgi:hypothetical protein